MKSKINRLSPNLASVSSSLAVSVPAFVVTGDTRQPIHTGSDQQSLDTQGNVVTFTDNVIVTRDTIEVNANRVIVTRPGGEDGKEVIDGYDNPVTLYQVQDNSEPVKSHTSQMYYELVKDLVVLTGKAYLGQLNSNIAGDEIICLIKGWKIRAFSDKGKRTTTVLILSQPQDKNRALAEKEGN